MSGEASDVRPDIITDGWENYLDERPDIFKLEEDWI